MSTLSLLAVITVTLAVTSSLCYTSASPLKVFHTLETGITGNAMVDGGLNGTDVELTEPASSVQQQLIRANGTVGMYAGKPKPKQGLGKGKGRPNFESNRCECKTGCAACCSLLDPGCIG